MKRLLLIALMFVVQHTFAQTTGSRNEKRREYIRDMFTYGEEGIFAGPVTGFEMNTTMLGGELRLYGAYYDADYASLSVYANARHLFNEGTNLPRTAIGVGGHFSVFGLEATTFLGGERTFFYLTPKIGIDHGQFSVFYGYGLPLSNNSPSGIYLHSVTVKLSLNFLKEGSYIQWLNKREEKRLRKEATLKK